MKLLFGMGINDADYKVRECITLGYFKGKRKQKITYCPYFRRWTNMLMRCYNNKYQDKRPTYKGCTVCEEWLRFSAFKMWMETQDWVEKELDKDILFTGNKVYSPETCVFVTSITNSFMLEATESAYNFPIGVGFNQRVKKFTAYCRNPFTKKKENLGYFYSELAAHQAWLTRKLELAKLLAAEQDDPRVAKALVNKYEKYEEV